jgi:DNA-binding NarL/FixJ family response regulator
MARWSVPYPALANALVPSDVLRVAVVDDHAVFAEALAVRLDLEPDIEVVAVGFDPDAFLDVLNDLTVDVVLLDYDLGSLTGVSGMSLFEEVLRRRPDVHFVIVSGGDEGAAVVEGARLGMSGWVPKDAPVDLLLEVLRGVRRGETYIPARLLTTVLRLLSQPPGDRLHTPSPLAQLTARELEVLRCMVDGLSRAEIAERLNLSQNTVRTHVQRVLNKFGVHSSLSAVARAREAGLVGLRSRDLARL